MTESLSYDDEIYIAHLTTVHRRDDIRIFRKMALSTIAPGVKVFVAVADGKGDAMVDGVSIIDTGKPGNRLLRAVIGNWRMFRVARRLRPSAVHIHDPELIPAGFLILAGCRPTKVIYDSHEDAPAAIRTKTWIPAPLRALAAGTVHLMEKAAHRCFAGIITATPAIARNFGTDRRVRVVQNFPIMDELIAPANATKPEKPIFAYVGGISDIRGARQMAEAVKIIAGRAELHLAGEFHPLDLAQRLQHVPGFIQRGQLSRPEVATLLAQASAGLVIFQDHPNHVDAQPNKLFEYMSAGLPVIASNFPLWREIVEGNRCGICVDPTSPTAIADAMTWMLDNPAEAAAMGREGRQAVETRYNWQSQVETLIGAYREASKSPS